MRMKNDFVATVTHELKTPLASTRLLVDTLLEGRCRDETQQREYLELIARENKRLSRLIDNFLTFSRMERNKRTFNFGDVAPAEIVEAATDAVHENYERSGCNLAVEVADGLPPIVADKDAMVTVLLNLLDNACKYSEGDKHIELRIFEKEHAVCFQVKDNGIGMAKRELSKIFDRFYQVDQSLTRKVGGAGLGLSIVSFVVDAHGGTIDIQSELGKGSIFTVKIPLNGGSHGS
jgi:signal transduction histidine kinase